MGFKLTCSSVYLEISLAEVGRKAWRGENADREAVSQNEPGKRTGIVRELKINMRKITEKNQQDLGLIWGGKEGEAGVEASGLA